MQHRTATSVQGSPTVKSTRKALVNPIVVAFAEHEDGLAALRWATELAELVGTRLEVLAIHESTYAQIGHHWADHVQRGYRARMAAIVDEIVPPDAELVVLSSTDPVATISQHLLERRAGMWVMGYHDAHRYGGFGSARSAHHLLQHAFASVAVIRAGYEPLSGGTVVVGVDGSGTNANALQHAVCLGERAHGAVHAVFAEDRFEYRSQVGCSADEVRREVELITTAPIELYLTSGHPVDALLTHADHQYASAIVIGAHRHGDGDGPILGHIPSQLIGHATTPIIVVPTGPLPDPVARQQRPAARADRMVLGADDSAPSEDSFGPLPSAALA